MTKKEMTEIFSVMMLAYPNAEMFKGGIQKLGPTIELWTACLSDVDFWLAQQAVVRLCRSCKFPPTIAELKEQADSVTLEIENEVKNAYLNARNVVNLCHGDLNDAYGIMPARTRSVIDAMGGIDKFAPPDARMFNMDGFERTYERMLKSNNALADGQRLAISGARKERS